MSSVLVTNDLLFSSQAAGAATTAAVEIRVVGALDQLLDAEPRPALVLLDLSMPGLDPSADVPRVRAAMPGAAIVAYGPHVHEDRLQQARDAGCTEVLTRGQMHRDLDRVLRQYAP